MEKKDIWIIVGIMAAVLLVALYFTGIPKAGATDDVKVEICHCEQPDSDSPFQCQTLEVGVSGSIAHLEEHDADYAGACLEIIPSPTEEITPTPEVTVTPEVTPTGSPSATPTLTPVPTTTIIPTPTSGGSSEQKKSEKKTVVPEGAPVTGRG